MMKEYDEKTLKKLQSIEMKILKDFVKVCDQNDLTYFGLAGTGIGALRHQGFIPWDDDIDIALPREDFDKFIQIASTQLSDEYEILNTAHDANYPLMTTRLVLKGTKFKEFALKDIDCNFGIFLDLYPFDNLSDDPKKFKKQARMAWFWSKILILRNVPHPVLAFKGWKANLVQFICACVHYSLKIMHVKQQWIYQKCLSWCTKYNQQQTKRIGFLCDTSPYTNMFDIQHIYPLRKLPFEDILLNFPADLEAHLTYMYGDYMKLPPIEKRKNHYPYCLDFGDY